MRGDVELRHLRYFVAVAEPKAHGGGEDETAHVTAILEPANSGILRKRLTPTADAGSARIGIDSGGSSFSRSRRLVLSQVEQQPRLHAGSPSAKPARHGLLTGHE